MNVGRKKKVDKVEEPIVVESKAIEVIKPEEKPLALPESFVTIPIKEYEQIRKPFNPMPWLTLITIIFGGFIVGGMALAILISKPEPVVTVIPTIVSTSIPTVKPTETLVPTLTLVPTPTKDVMLNMQVINNYYSLLSSGDLEAAWNCLTLKFRRDSFGNNFEEFKAHWSRTGPVAVYEIVPEKESDGQAVALVRLYFYYEQRIRYYRFHLQYNPLDNIWQIDFVETARPW